jgi:hypothetical protein
MIMKIGNQYKFRKISVIIIIGFLSISLIASCTSGKKNIRPDDDIEMLVTNNDYDGYPLQIEFVKGVSHNHPLMAFWIEDTEGNYLETLYVASSIGTGVFGHGKINKGAWEPGPVSRPAALPYWWHKYGFLPTPGKEVPDAITGPTPQGNFILKTSLVSTQTGKINVLMEINQSWDWNENWTNDKYPGNTAYMSSSQPALVYKASVDLSSPDSVYLMEAIGHSHYAGEDGSLNKDISTLTTALKIAGVIKVSTGKSDR